MMEHKAFIFDDEAFERELLPILEKSLITDDCSELISFILKNRGTLTDPDEGEPLPDDWEGMLETLDPHQYGDFALTKYYDPQSDIGLGTVWQSIQELIPENGKISPILGTIVGTWENSFDPGKIGSYFQSKQQVQTSLAVLQNFAKRNPSAPIDESIYMLELAAQAHQGLYVTF